MISNVNITEVATGAYERREMRIKLVYVYIIYRYNSILMI